MAGDALILKIEDFPGLGDGEYPGFPADDCPELPPDLAKHHSLMADVLKRCPELYEQLRERRTALGVGLARCIKTGIDNRGHPMIKTIGAVAGDAECYDTFQPLFDQLIQLRHGEESLRRPHAASATSAFLSQLSPDPTEKYVLSVQVRAARNLQGMRFSPACSFEERREIERMAARALLELEGPLKGDYLPLRGSQSHPAKAGGMSAETEKELQRKGLLFTFPDSSAVLSSGVGRHWPDARGVFLNESQTLAVWVNEEEHFRAVAARQGSDLKGAFKQIMDTFDSMVMSFQRNNDRSPGFACSERLGYLTSCPSNIGTAMRVSAIVKLPLIVSRQKSLLMDWCSRRRITARSAIGESGAQMQGVVEISNRDRLGISEHETVNLLINSVAALVHAERLLEQGGAGLQPPVEAAPVQAEQVASDTADWVGMSSLLEDEEGQWEVAGETFSRLFASALSGSAEPVVPADAVPAATDVGSPPVPQQGPVPPLADIKLRTASLLEAAVDSGALSTALGSLAEATQFAEEARQRAGEMLFQAAQDGQLSGALASMSGRQCPPPAPDPPGTSVEDLRQRAAELLGQATTDGALQGALESIERGAPPSAAQESLRQRAAQLLFQATEDGALQGALESLERAAPNSPDQKSLRQRAAELLAQATEDGALLGALESIERTQEPKDARAAPVAAPAAPPAERGPDLDALRREVKSTLEGALQTGTLQRLIEAEAQPVGTAEGGQAVTALGELRGALEAALEDGSLERLLESDEFSNDLMGETLADLRGSAHAWLSEGPQERVADVSFQAADLVWDACDNGALEQALGTLREQAELDVEDIRSRMKTKLHEAVDDGSLDQVFRDLSAPKGAREGGGAKGDVPGEGEAGVDIEDVRYRLRAKAEEAAVDMEDVRSRMRVALGGGAGSAEPAPSVVPAAAPTAVPAGAAVGVAGPGAGFEEVRRKVRQGLEQSFASGHLESWLQGGSAANKPSTAEEDPLQIAPVLGKITPLPVVAGSRANGAALTQCAQSLLEALSGCDRRIGLLNATIAEVRRCLSERDVQVSQLQAELEAVHQDHRSLDVEIDRQREAIEQAEATAGHLQENQRRLANEIEAETMKQRHAAVDLDATHFSVRSETSTACTLCDSLPLQFTRDAGQLLTPLVSSTSRP